MRGPWLDDLWTQHMLSLETYLAYAVEVRIGFLARRRQMKADQAYEAIGRLRKEQFGVFRSN